MTYSLEFKEDALDEWLNLDGSIKELFKKKLEQRLIEPRVPKSKLNGTKDCYKIKLRSSGFRLVYKVIDNVLMVDVIAVGKREKNAVYKAAIKCI